MFTDIMPPLVSPDTEEGRKWAREDYDGAVAFCRRYEPYKRDYAMVKTDRYAIYECKNRQPFGERRKNWCFVCPAGFMFTEQHIYDAELPRDRVMFVAE